MNPAYGFLAATVRLTVFDEVLTAFRITGALFVLPGLIVDSQP
jgi:hypothetical protein